MMRITRCFGLIVLSLVALAATGIAGAACPGTTFQTPGNCLYAPGFSTVGGDLVTTSQRLLASNMDPFQRQGTTADLIYWKDAADASLTAGKTFRDGLLLIGATPNDGTARGNLLNDQKLNYQSAGLLTDLAAIEARLLSARDTYAYLLYRGYPNAATAKSSLLDTIKTLANLYLMIADEFLIDALEWRFSAATGNVDEKLDEQIGLLQSAQDYYQKAISVFVYGFSPAVGTNIYVSASFDDAVFSLFNIGVERLSLALRELSSKQLVRQMAPDPNQEWTAARSASLATMKEANIAAYLLTSAIANTQGTGFDAVGGGSSIVSALSALRTQGNIYNQGLNPLGYDNRYVPLTDYDQLYRLAHDNGLLKVGEAETRLQNDKRMFDSNQEALAKEVESLIDQYVYHLLSMTGCTLPTNLADQTQVDAFIVCTGESGTDLFDCRLDMDTTNFETCMTASKTRGVLAQKYRDTMAAQLRVNQARLARHNIFAQIALENEKAGAIATIKRSRTATDKVRLDDYWRKLEEARLIKETVTETSVRVWDRDKKKWGKAVKQRSQATETSYTITDTGLDLEHAHEMEMMAITTEYEIADVELHAAYTIKNLLLSAAEAEIALQLAVQQKNSALADFDNALQEKESLWYLYQRARGQLSYYVDKFAPLRILRSEAAINLAAAMNYTAHYAYLAAKALEYQQLTPLDNLPVGAGRYLRLTDLFKAQTHQDLSDFLVDLDTYGKTACGWSDAPTVAENFISLAIHVKGWSDDSLDPDGDGYAANGLSVEHARKALVQGFIIEHINANGHLQFGFTIAEDASFMRSAKWYNVKLWHGYGPSTCPQVLNPARGVAVQLKSSQGSSYRPKARIRQTGHSSLRNAFGEFSEYIPINDLHFLFEGGGAFVPWVESDSVVFRSGEDPRAQSGGSWTPAFKGRSISSSEWEVEIYDFDPYYAKTNLDKISDILIHMDVLGNYCPNCW